MLPVKVMHHFLPYKHVTWYRDKADNYGHSYIFFWVEAPNDKGLIFCNKMCPGYSSGLVSLYHVTYFDTL